jgi:hypothetical protein
VQRNAEIAGARNLRLAQPRPVHRAGPQRGQPETPALVEAQRGDVVVGGGQRDLLAAAALGLDTDGLDEHRADARELVQRVDRDDLQHVAPHVEGDEPGDAAAAFRDETGQRRRVEDVVVHGHFGGAPQLSRQPLDGGAVGLLHEPDRYLPITHRLPPAHAPDHYPVGGRTWRTGGAAGWPSGTSRAGTPPVTASSSSDG